MKPSPFFRHCPVGVPPLECCRWQSLVQTLPPNENFPTRFLGLPIRIGTKADHRCKYGSPACARINPIRRGGRTNNLPSSPQVRANDISDVIRTGDILVVTALERLGRDTLGLLELINRAGHHGRGAEGAGYAGDALGSVVIFTVISAKAGIQRPLAASAYLPATGFYRILVSRFLRNDGKRGLETDILKLTTLPRNSDGNPLLGRGIWSVRPIRAGRGSKFARAMRWRS